MKILTSLFASALIATSLFASTAFAATEDSQITNAQQVVFNGGGSAGGRYHECFLAGDIGCKKLDGKK